MPEQSHTTLREGLTRVLGDDHLEIDAQITNLRAMIADGELERAETYLPDLSDRLLHHIRVESEVLLPLLERRIPHFRPSSVMRHEHRRIEALLALLERQLAASQPRDAGSTFEQLDRILVDHHRHEESALYPCAEHELTDAEQRLVATALRHRL